MTSHPPRLIAFRMLKDDTGGLVGLLFLVVIVSLTILGIWLVPENSTQQDLRARLQPPTLVSSDPEQTPHIFGTDQLGRDMLVRLLQGARVSLLVGLLSVLASGTIGVALGLLAGYYRGWVDSLIMWLINVQMSFPSLLTALMVLYVIGSGLLNVVLVLSISLWVGYARLVRGIMLQLSERPFVEASRALGSSDRRILIYHLLPNLGSPIFILATLEFGTAVLAEAGLSFLGLGIQAPDTSWGLMVAQGREYMTTAWWLTVIPGLCILLTVLSINLLVTFVRNVTDPAVRGRWLQTQQSSARKRKEGGV